MLILVLLKLFLWTSFSQLEFLLCVMSCSSITLYGLWPVPVKTVIFGAVRKFDVLTPVLSELYRITITLYDKTKQGLDSQLRQS